ncbi:MAG: HPF/RaiA family ribosome-associated protein [Planctomycetota bacterium]|nr:HPF/RaiA family ribosome-associated protein [Planctomycetota bacterium]
MQTPLQVVFHDLERSEAIEDAVRRHAEELERHFDRITSCRVVVEAPHRHQHKGRTYAVRIDIAVPRKEIVVNREPGRDEKHEDVYVAINDAFKAAKRQLKDYAQKLRGEVKRHATEPE